MHALSHGTTSTPTTIAVPPALSLPVIEAVFPRQLHPYWPKLQGTTRAWLLEKRLMPADKVEEHADGLCYTDLMAGYYTGAPDEVLQAIADYSAWFFVWDDRHDRDIVHGRPAAWRRLKEQLHSALDSPADHLGHGDPLSDGRAHAHRRRGRLPLPTLRARPWFRRQAPDRHHAEAATPDAAGTAPLTGRAARVQAACGPLNARR
ncbi:hypothetical protein SGRIM128S_06346 [Streptomyces griseomycini]